MVCDPLDANYEERVAELRGGRCRVDRWTDGGGSDSSVYPSIRLSVYPSIRLSVYPSIRLSAHPPPTAPRSPDTTSDSTWACPSHSRSPDPGKRPASRFSTPSLRRSSTLRHPGGGSRGG